MFPRLMYPGQAYTWCKLGALKTFFHFWFSPPSFFFFPSPAKILLQLFLKAQNMHSTSVLNFMVLASFAKGHILGSFDQNCQPWEKERFSTVTWPILPALSCLQNKICASKSFSQEFIEKSSKHCRQRRI